MLRLTEIEQQPILVELVIHERWEEAIERMRTEEGKEELRNSSGHHLLHWACLHSAPFHLVEAMLVEYPELAKVTESDFYSLPLHIACRPMFLDHVSPRVVRLLLDTHPEGAKATDAHGWLPLHSAAFNSRAPLEILRMLIDAHPDGVATPTDRGELPIHCCASAEWEEYEGNPIHDDLDAFVENKERVERIKALYCPIQNNEESLLTTYNEEMLVGETPLGETPLHIAQRFDLLSVDTCLTIARCPAEIIISTARRHPEQLRDRDQDGNYPLHIVSSNPCLNGARVLTMVPTRESRGDVGREGVEAGDDGDNEAGRDQGIVERSEASVDGGGGSNENVKVEKDLITEFVKLYPEAAAARNADGNFPLYLAIESGKKWHEGVEAIANAAEHVVVVGDETADLYPFRLAATSDNSCLDTVFSLLRRCPELERFKRNALN